jgi:hypothetical protein
LNLKDAARRSMGRATADSLGPTEWPLGSLALVLADLIARMPCRSSIDRRGPVGCVLRDVRRDVEVAQTLSLHPSFSMLLISREISRSIPRRTPGAGVFRSRIVPGAAVARRHGAAMTASSSDASRNVWLSPPRLTRRHPNRVQATYRVEVLANSTLGQCGQRALTVPRTRMTAPSVITPRNANKLKKAKQLSGTASASNKSRFLAKYVCLRLRLRLRLRRPAKF